MTEIVESLWNWLVESHLTGIMALHKGSFILNELHYGEKSWKMCVCTSFQDNDGRPIRSASVILLLDNYGQVHAENQETKWICTV